MAIGDGVTAGQDIVSAGASQSCETDFEHHRQQRSQSRPPALSSSGQPLRHHEVHRHLHSSAGSGVGRQPRHPHCRVPGDSLSQRAALSEARERVGHRSYRVCRCQRGSRTRQFHHATPLERAIAGYGDGIDYIESQSTQGLSTINVRLKLSTSARRTRLRTSVRASIRCAPINRRKQKFLPSTSSRQNRKSRRCTWSFGSKILEDNQVTDYLIRVVQPRLSAIEGVQRADILGGRTFAIRAWLKADRMAALNVSPSEVRQALAANNTSRAVGTTKGALIQINPHGDHGPQVARRVQEARGPPAKRRSRPLRRCR